MGRASLEPHGKVPVPAVDAARATGRLRRVKTQDLRDLVHFSDEGALHHPLFETEHLWSEVLCLQAAQGVGPMTDVGSDAVVAVLSGEVAAQVDKGRARMKQWESVLVPAGSELTIRNASDEPSVVLLVLAPPPAPSETAGP
jgi:quercetin dioxygenase-like cupin family protein